MRKRIPVLKRVAIMVWQLANVVSYCLEGERFGVRLSTAGERVIEVCFATELELLATTVKLGEVGRVSVGLQQVVSCRIARQLLACCGTCG